MKQCYNAVCYQANQKKKKGHKCPASDLYGTKNLFFFFLLLEENYKDAVSWSRIMFC